MSPVDSSAVDSSENAPKIEREKRDSAVQVEADTSNATQTKPKKKKRHVPRPEVAAEGVVSELPSSVVNGHRKGKKSKEGSKTGTETSLVPEKDRGENKSKKRKRKEGDGDGSNAIDTQLEATLNDKPEDEKKAKKRKHKEDGSPSKQHDVPDEVGVVATKAKKRKKSKASAVVE